MIRQIALFGGSFDPPHLGHLDVAKHVLDKVHFLDELWFMPVGNHPWQPCKAGAEDRFNMIVCATKNIQKTHVLDIETKSAKTSYTIDTILKLNNLFPDTLWYLVLGADTAQTVDQWERYDELVKKTRFIVVARSGFLTPTTLPKNTILLHDAGSSIRQITSSEIRRRVCQGQPIDSLTHPCTQRYIKTHTLYL